MTKTEIINDIIYDMSPELTKEQLDRLKFTMLVKMKDFEITEMTTLPCVEVYDNDWLLKRFLIDSIASGLKESTIKQYVDAVRRLFEATKKNYRQLTGQDITDYLAAKQCYGKIGINYKSTLNRYFFSFFGWAYRKRHIPEEIMRDVDRVKPVQKKKERLTDEEVEDLREACKTLGEKALLELMLSTGMRVGEIVALNISDIDLNRKRLIIYGEKTSQYRTGMLTTKATKALRAYIASRTDDNKALFVTSRKPNNRLGKNSIQNIVKRLAVRAGITRISVTVHVYRKTFASQQYRKTKNILYVSKLLGHANSNTTVQYYLVDDIDDMQHVFDVAN